MFALPAFAADSLVSAVTQPSRISETASGDSFVAQILEAPGRVVFVSRAPNVVGDDTHRNLQVFIRDVSTRQTRLLSARSGDGRGGGGDSFNPSASADGQRVAFESAASDLVDRDGNQLKDVFLRDLAEGTTTLLSVSTGSDRSAGGSSGKPTLTPDGRYVVFESTAPDLVSILPGADTNRSSDVFLRDLDQGVTWLLSHRQGDTNAAANGASTSPVITPDASVVAFISSATNLVPGPKSTSSSSEVYARDMAQGVVEWVSAGADTTENRQQLRAGPGSSLYSCSPALSANGRWIAFKTLERGGQRALVLRYDRQSHLTQWVSSNAVGSTSGIADTSGPVMSGDGRFMAYEGRVPTGSGFSYDSKPVVYVWDSQTGTESLASVAPDAVELASGASNTPLLSADGHYLVFLSDSTNLVAGFTPTCSQVFWRDLQVGETRLISVRLDGLPVEEPITSQPSLSPSGLSVGYQTRSPNIVHGDYNDAHDVFVYDVGGGTPDLVSERNASAPSYAGAGGSRTSRRAVTPGGRWVAFTSASENLVANDHNGQPDVFVRDLTTGACEWVSVAGSGASSAAGFSRNPAISADGRFVAFSSYAPDLLDPAGGVLDTNVVEDIFLRDRTTGKARALSVNLGGTATGNKSAVNPSISADGRFVAYESAATDLVASDTNGRSDVFVFDTQGGTNDCLSLKAFGFGTALQGASAPVISPDGRWVAFQSSSRDLTTLTAAGSGALYFVRDLQTRTNRCVSSALPASMSSSRPDPVFSADSKLVAFTWAGNSIYVHDLIASQTTLAVTGGINPDLSADGRYLAYETASTTSGSVAQIMWLDRQTSARRLVSVNLDGAIPTGGASHQPMISADGNYVVFQSRANDLVPGDNNHSLDVFVRDIRQNVTFLVSRSALTQQAANSLSTVAAMSADGATVVLHTFASDLAAGDFNAQQDIYYVQLAYGDSDHDGMPDPWEVTYFGNLARDGKGDIDGDGVSDLDEYLAGTNPINDLSVLQVMTITSVTEGQTTVIWSAVVGRAYRVQYKDNLEDPTWFELPAPVTATSTQAAAIDDSTPAPTHRFYRVVVVP